MARTRPERGLSTTMPPETSGTIRTPQAPPPTGAAAITSPRWSWSGRLVSGAVTPSGKPIVAAAPLRRTTTPTRQFW